MPSVTLTVRSEHPIPRDVLIEHIAVALRDFEFAGKRDIVAHPFDIPSNVVFDDTPLNDEELTALDPFPMVTRALDALKERNRGE